MTEFKNRNIEFHVQLLAIFTATLTVFASIGLLIGGMVLLPAVFLTPFSDIPISESLEIGLLGLGSMAMLFAVGNLMLGLSAAYGLLKKRPWGRVLGIIDCALSLIFFPMGTIYGVYGLWVLLPQDAQELFGCCDEQELKMAQ